jgi:hypothetical protein
MFSIKKAKSISELVIFQNESQKSGLHAQDLDFLENCQVYLLYTSKNDACGGFVINSQRPFRTLTPEWYQEDALNSLVLRITPYQPLEVTAVWLAKKYRGSWVGVYFWLAMAFVVRSQPQKWMIFGTFQEKLARYYQKGRNTRLLHHDQTQNNPETDCWIYLAPTSSMGYTVFLSILIKISKAIGGVVRKRSGSKAKNIRIGPAKA